MNLNLNSRRNDRAESFSSELSTKEDGGQAQKPTENPEALQTTSTGAQINAQTIFFFLLLVANSTTLQLFFKLSQKGGKYEYNTMSAMVMVEGGKLFITFCQLMLAHKGKVKDCAAQFKGVPRRVKFAYIFLAFSYAVYNQLVFFVMRLVDPATFVIVKSLTPGAVAFLQFFAFRMSLTQSQLFCILIQICGIIPVTASTNSETGKVDFTYGMTSMLIMLATLMYGAFNSVYNARVVKKESANTPVTVQNGMLYSAGVIVNLMFYFFSFSPEDKGFFYGYNNINVIVLLFLNSTVGITISMVYKYGDAILKSLAQPVVSSILLFLSKFLFDLPLDIIKLSGAGTVIFSTMLYLKLPGAPPPKPSPTVMPAQSRPLTHSNGGNIV